MGVGAGLYMYVVVVQKFTFAISSPDEFLFILKSVRYWNRVHAVSYMGSIQSVLLCLPLIAGVARYTLYAWLARFLGSNAVSTHF